MTLLPPHARHDTHDEAADIGPEVPCSFGADDGIRTRDPHLGMVPEAGPLTCDDVLILPVTWEFFVGVQ